MAAAGDCDRRSNFRHSRKMEKLHKSIVVLKVGTSSLVDVVSQKPKVSSMARLAEATANLISAGFHVIIVSSGAVGLGCARVGLKEKPSYLAGKQAAAAIGQVRLMALWDALLETQKLPCAQALLSADVFGDRTQYLNARNTLVEPPEAAIAERNGEPTAQS